MSISDDMTAATGRPIEAAGGVLWRAAIGGDGLEVALVHRPKYDDWSVPKGKLATGENAVLGALREVWEETGFRGTPGRPLGEVHYVKDGSPKRVRYWAVRAEEGEFTPNDEVDQLIWLPPRQARRHLDPIRDRDLLDGITREKVDTRAMVMVRHGSAGERSTWDGHDDARPLDERGVVQATALLPLLSAYRPVRVAAADVERCRQTIEPVATATGIRVQEEKVLSERGYAEDVAAAVERVVELISDDGLPTVLCSQGRVIPGLLAGLLERFSSTAVYAGVRKGGLAVAHVSRLEDSPAISAVEWFEPLG